MHLAQQQQAIGVFDSGVGGISVLQHIHTLLPHEHCIYVADSFYAPYGTKTPAQIKARTVVISDFLLRQSVKAIVVACNTATAAAIDDLRARYTLPIIGMEPAVKPAVAVTKTGVVGVLATVGTLQSAQFSALLAHYGQGVKVMTQACIGLVECVERGALNSAKTKALVAQYCAPLLAAGADTIVLGCTHYPFVKALIREVVGENVHLIDTGKAVANQLKSQLDKAGLSNPHTTPANITFYSNSTAPDAAQTIQTLWGNKPISTLLKFDS